MDNRIREAIGLIDKHIQRLMDAKKVLEDIDSGEIMTPRMRPAKPAAGKPPAPANNKRKPHNLGPEARARIAAGQKKRWDAYRANGGAESKQQKAAAQ